MDKILSYNEFINEFLNAPKMQTSNGVPTPPPNSETQEGGFTLPEAEGILQAYADEYGAKIQKHSDEEGLYDVPLRNGTYTVRMSKKDDHIAFQIFMDDSANSSYLEDGGGYQDDVEGPFTEETLNEVIDAIDEIENEG